MTKYAVSITVREA